MTTSAHTHPTRPWLRAIFGLLCTLVAFAPTRLDAIVSGLGPDGKFYEVVLYTDGTTLSWEEARDEALAHHVGGARLAEIYSEEIDLLIEKLRQEALTAAGIDPASSSAPALWIGGAQASGATRPDVGWTWDTSGNPLPGNATQTGYSNWLEDEPNDWPSAPENGEEDHAAIGFQGKFGWNDYTTRCTGYVRQHDISTIAFDTGPQIHSDGFAYHYLQGPLCLDYEEAAYCARRMVYERPFHGLFIGQLGKVGSASEWSRLNNVMSEHIVAGWDSTSALGPFWLGATQIESASTVDAGWSWLDGSPIDSASYDNWLAGQPDDAPGSGENGEQNRLAMDHGQWNDIGADEELFAMLVDYRDRPPHELVTRSTRYDGASAMRYPYLPGYTRNVQMCVEGWIFREGTGPVFQTILSQGFTNSIWLGLAGGKLRFYRSGGTFADSTGTVPLGQWTHFAASYDGSFVRFYINGQTAGEHGLANGGTGLADDFYLGRDPGSNPYYLSAHLDEVRLWSTTRTGAQLRAEMYNELTSASGLEQVWPNGGLDAITGAAVDSGTPTTERFGMLPKSLVVPAASTQPTFDGDVNLDTEYAGAEQVVLRYADGAGFKDAVGYLVHTKDYLYLGVEGARLPAVGSPSIDNAFSAYVDGDGTTTSFDPDMVQGISFLQDEASGYARVKPVTIGVLTFNQWSSTPAPEPHQFGSRVGKQVRDELSSAPDIEYRFHRELLGGFDYTALDRFALAHTDNGGTNGDRWSPDGADRDTPASWVEMRYFPAPDPGIPTLRASGVVTNPSSGTGVSGVTVSVQASTTLATTTTDAGGNWSFNGVALPEGVAYRIRFTPPASSRTDLVAEASAVGIQPTSLFATEAYFPPCFSGSCTTAPLTFYVFPPIPATVLGNFAPSEAWPPVLLRGGVDPRRVTPTTVRVDGTNLHDLLDFYFARPHCPNEITATCTPGIDYFPIAGTPAVSTFVPATDTDVAHVLVEVPDIPRLRWGFMRLTAHDRWSRAGNVPSTASSWKNFPAQIAIVEPPYELIHGFHFENIKDGHDIDDYRAAFYDQVCDPRYMVGFWAFSPLYLSILGNGECVGLAVTAQRLARGRQSTTPLNPDVYYGNGFRTHRQFDGSEHPVLPATFDVSNPCSPAPTNIWAAVRANHGVQMSSEFIGATLEQFRFGPINDWIDIGAQISKMRGQEREWIICMRNGAKGHCVQPLRIIDTADPNIKQIEIWDNNFPEQTQTIDINLNGRDRYTYTGLQNPAEIDPVTEEEIRPATPWSGNWLLVYRVDSIYDGNRHVPSIDTAGHALARFGVTHLWDLLQLIVSGDAEPMVTSGNGSQVGWNAAGEFIETGEEVAAIPNFNWIPDDTPPLGHYPASFHTRTDSGAPSVEIHNRGNDYKIHASHHGTMFQFFVSDAIPGASDQMTTTHQPTDGRVDGTCFEAGAGGRDVEVRIALCKNASEYPAAVSLGAIRVHESEQVMIRTKDDGTGFHFFNNTGDDVNTYFDLAVASPTGSQPDFYDTPDLLIPQDAELTVESPDGTDFANMVFLLDFDRDGAPEESWQFDSTTSDFVVYVPPPTPFLRFVEETDPDTYTIAYPLGLDDWEVQLSESLDEGEWNGLDPQQLGATIDVIGDEVHVTLPIDQFRRIFLRFAEK